MALHRRAQEKRRASEEMWSTHQGSTRHEARFSKGIWLGILVGGKIWREDPFILENLVRVGGMLL